MKNIRKGTVMDIYKDLEQKCVFQKEIDEESGIPMHAMKVPIDKIPNPGYEFYCYDSRRNECEYWINFEGKNYCTYSKD